jgi:hypothetical protein
MPAPAWHDALPLPLPFAIPVEIDDSVALTVARPLRPSELVLARWLRRVAATVERAGERILGRLDLMALGAATASGLGEQHTATQGWPGNGSTVQRIVRVPLDEVQAEVRAGGTWDGLCAAAVSSVGVSRLDGRIVSRGRLRIPRTVRSVPVELRLSAYSSSATVVELVLTGRFRFPRRYWTIGHAALTALKHAAGD